MTSPDPLFRIGPGYVAYWMHEVLEHWSIDDRLKRETWELSESLSRLIQRRDEVERARRAFLPASSFDQGGPPSDHVQQALFEATQQFFLTFYASISAFASFLSRFRSILGNVPHASMQKFIVWLDDYAFDHEIVTPLLEEARRFRNLLDHRGRYQPFTWGTSDNGGQARVFLHGPASPAGERPEGAIPRLPGDGLPDGDDWVFVAPDEDRVLAAIAVQLNALLPVIGSDKQDHNKMRSCKWELVLGPGDPPGGYNMRAARPGTVVAIENGNLVIENDSTFVTRKTRREIDQVLGSYFDEEGNWKGDYS